MLQKTITKFSIFVISFSSICLIFSGCYRTSSKDTQEQNSNGKNSADYAEPKIVGQIKSDEIKESSGIAASLCQENVLWTHNDSGDKAFIYALDLKGERLGTWLVTGAKNTDWEDISAFQDSSGTCFLYLGDIGNNKRAREEFTIYRVKEPAVSDGSKSSSKKNPLTTEMSEAIRVGYPETRHDAETLMVHPQSGDIYILSKRMNGASGVYKLAAGYSLDKTNVLKKIADLSVPAIPNGFLTGGSISPDGKRVIICDYFDGYEIVLPATAKNFDEIWKEEPKVVRLGAREQGEAICYAADGSAIFATSEKKNSPLIEVKRK